MLFSRQNPFLWLAAAFCLSLAIQAQPASSLKARRVPWESFDSVLSSILRASRDDFAILEGARVENRRRDWFYEAKAFLPEATYCRIFYQGGAVFCCEWDETSPGGSTLLYDKLVGAIGTALTGDWSKKAKADKLRKEVVFTGDHKPVIHAILQSNPAQVLVLVLPPGSSKEGFAGNVPSIHGFVHP